MHIGKALFVVLVVSFCLNGFAGQAWAAGAEVFNTCKSCHEVGPDAKNAVGPHLNDLFGRRAGSVAGVTYSDDMVRSGHNGLIWNRETLDIYLENPRSLISKTLMMFPGIKDAEARAQVIDYLRTFSVASDDARDAPSSASALPRDSEVVSEILKIQGDPEYGEYLAGECLTCHQGSGKDRGIPSIVGWPIDVFVTAMHAYRSKTRNNPVMQTVASRLKNEDIASLAAYFKKLGK